MILNFAVNARDAMPGGGRLVKDDESVLELAVEILSRSAYEVIEASNGMEGLPVFERLERDIETIVTDMVMRQMGGRDLATKITTTQP